MIVVNLKGGLGNQMFQYALGRSLGLLHNVEFKMDTTFLLDRTIKEKNFVFRDYDLGIFNVKDAFATAEEVGRLKTKLLNNNTADRLIKKFTGVKQTYIKEPYFHFYPEVFKAGPDIYLDGYWQSPKYFEDYEKIIREDFTFKTPVAADAASLVSTINNTNSVCVNVRRGDFVTSSVHNVVGLDYYSSAEKILEQMIGNLHFFVFSDDIPWCKEHLRFSGQTSYVSHEYAGHKFSDYLQLMSLCKHFIIPNSTFAWWAAWLNQYAGKIVIAPRKWFSDEVNSNTSDLIPAAWIRI